MRSLLYLIAVILIIGWILGFLYIVPGNDSYIADNRHYRFDIRRNQKGVKVFVYLRKLLIPRMGIFRLDDFTPFKI